jgi:hypothetical protein
VERLSPFVPLPRLAARFAWEWRRAARAFMRSWGGFGLIVGAAVLVGLAAWWVGRQQSMSMAQTRALLERRLAAPEASIVPLPEGGGGQDGRARLKAFDDYLLTHADIPSVVQNLIRLAEAEKLVLARGDYRPQADVQGGFLRYRMSLPVKGDAQAIRRFMQAALLAHRTLALEGVQFKRERIESATVEARLQWVLLTRPPAAPESSR